MVVRAAGCQVGELDASREWSCVGCFNSFSTLIDASERTVARLISANRSRHACMVHQTSAQVMSDGTWGLGDSAVVLRRHPTHTHERILCVVLEE